ncbi:MAG: hypothetical protein IKN11_01970 [Bacteroidales bacterium]|nr:hypothetical protein [Bacteroidales bacterium]
MGSASATSILSFSSNLNNVPSPNSNAHTVVDNTGSVIWGYPKLDNTPE